MKRPYVLLGSLALLFVGTAGLLAYLTRRAVTRPLVTPSPASLRQRKARSRMRVCSARMSCIDFMKSAADHGSA